jgi:hypothetical protein
MLGAGFEFELNVLSETFSLWKLTYLREFLHDGYMD